MLKLFLLIGISFYLALPGFAEPIHVAAREGDVATVLKLVEEGTPVDLPSTADASVAGSSPLLVAIKWGKLEVVEALLAAGADVNFKTSDDFDHDTPALNAVRYGRLTVLEQLLDNGVDVNATTSNGSLLHNAMVTRRQDVVDFLIQRGALPSISAPSVEPLLAAADIERGRRLFGTCRGCHRGSEEKDGGSRTTPSLWGVVGRDIASLPDVEYSDALTAAPGDWTYDSLNSFLANPGAFIPGTSMSRAAPI